MSLPAKKIGEMTTPEIFKILFALTKPGDSFSVSPASPVACFVTLPSGNTITYKPDETQDYSKPAKDSSPELLLAMIYISSMHKRPFYFKNTHTESFTDYFQFPRKAV